MLRRPCNGYVKHTGTALGRGVFAAKRFAAGDLVELCPVVVMRCDFKALPLELQQRVFDWSTLAKVAGTRALALGYGSLYNHANQANLCYEPSEDGTCLRFVAAVDIGADSELTINYNGTFGKNISDEDDWFESNGIVPYVRAEERRG